MSSVIVDLSAVEDDDSQIAPTLTWNVGAYWFEPEALRQRLLQGGWLDDMIICCFVYIVCGYDSSAFVDSQVLRHWVGGRHDYAPRGSPSFLIVNENNVHWYLIYVDHVCQGVTAYGTSRVSRRLQLRLREWLAWPHAITTRATLLTGDRERDHALASTECGVAVCRAVADILCGEEPGPPRLQDRQWIWRTLAAAAGRSLSS